MTVDTNQAASFGELPTLARWSARGAAAFLVLALVVAALNLGHDPGDVGYRVVVSSAVVAAVVLALVVVIDRRVLAGGAVPGGRLVTLALTVLLLLQTVVTVLLVALSLVPDGVGHDTVPVLALGIVVLFAQSLATVAAGRSWRFQKPRARRAP